MYSRTASTTRARSPSPDDVMVPVVDEMTMVSDATTVVGAVVVGAIVVGATVVGGIVVGLLTIHYFHPSFSL